MLCSWTAAFSPSLSRGPSFPECFRLYFWGQQTGKQEWEILPWQVVRQDGFNSTVPAEAASSYCLSQMLVYMDATEKPGLGDPTGAPSPPEPLLTRTRLGGPHAQGPREKEVGTRPRRSRSSPAPRLRRLTWPRGTTTDTPAGNGKLEKEK